MNARLWILIAAVVAELGCGDGGANDGAAGNPGSSGDTDCVWTGSDNGNKCTVCDGDATCDSPTYTDNGDGTVTSSCCGLVWQQVVDDNGGHGSGLYTSDEAKAYCAGLMLAGAGWRLPTIEELWSLVVLGQAPEDPTIDRTAFPNTTEANFWSSSAYIASASGAWSVGFNNGNSGLIDVSGTIRVRCVR